MLRKRLLLAITTMMLTASLMYQPVKAETINMNADTIDIGAFTSEEEARAFIEAHQAELESGKPVEKHTVSKADEERMIKEAQEKASTMTPETEEELAATQQRILEQSNGVSSTSDGSKNNASNEEKKSSVEEENPDNKSVDEEVISEDTSSDRDDSALEDTKERKTIDTGSFNYGYIFLGLAGLWAVIIVAVIVIVKRKR